METLCSTHSARASLKLPNVNANRTSRWNWVFLALKQLMMTLEFLREEAAALKLQRTCGFPRLGRPPRRRSAAAVKMIR